MSDTRAAPIRVVVADDHAILRAGLRALLDRCPDISVVGEAGHGDDVIRGAQKLDPHVVVLDLSMPGGGLGVLDRLREDTPGVSVVILTMHDDDALRSACMAGGAQAYVVKHGADTDLIEAIRTVHARGLRRSRRRSVRGERSAIMALTTRERDVLRLIAFGHTNGQISERLGIGIKTVETHRARLSRKLEAEDRADLVRHAVRAGLLVGRRGPPFDE